jgi:hypothetical protein
LKQILPEIRINDAWLLRQQASVHLNELWNNGKPLESDEYYFNIVKKYRKAWGPEEQKILTAMCDITELTFYQNVIDVYIAPWFNAFSSPLVIGVTKKPEQFVDTLTHELLHRLFTDNIIITPKTELLKEWQKLFGEEHTFTTVVHIPVHAVHKAIYLDVLNSPKRLKADIEEVHTLKLDDYIKAWDYVDRHGHQKIINQLKESSKKLAT